jgi:hypothetical protein
MKMVYANFNVSTLPAVVKILDENGVDDYQIVDHALSKNRKGDPRLDTSVWPGYNTLAFIPFADEDKARDIIQKFREFNKKVYTEAEIITACMWGIDEYLFE